MNSIDEKESQKVAQIKNWLIEYFHLPKSCKIEIIEETPKDKKLNTQQTTFYINYKNKKDYHFTIQKPINNITKEDFQKISKEIEAPIFRRFPIVGSLFRFFGMWFAVSSIYAMSSVCPFCGQPGCVVGSGSVGLVGGLFALFTLNWKTSFRQIIEKIRLKINRIK